MPSDERLARYDELQRLIRDAVEGAYYVTYYKSGKVQVNLEGPGRQAWVHMEALASLWRDNEDADDA